MAYFFERGKSLAGPLGLRKNLPIFLLRNRKNPPIVSSRRTTPDGAEPAPAARPERNSQPRHLADSVGDRDRGGGETKRFEVWKSGGGVEGHACRAQTCHLGHCTRPWKGAWERNLLLRALPASTAVGSLTRYSVLIPVAGIKPGPPPFRASKGRTDETMPTATREGAK